MPTRQDHLTRLSLGIQQNSFIVQAPRTCTIKLFTALPANTRLGCSCYRFVWIIHWVSSLIWFQHCQGIIRIQFWQFTDCPASSQYQFWQFFFTKSSVLIEKCCKKPDSLLLTLFRLKQNRNLIGSCINLRFLGS